MCRSRGPQLVAVDGSAWRARSTERFFTLASTAGEPASVGCGYRFGRKRGGAVRRCRSAAGHPKAIPAPLRALVLIEIEQGAGENQQLNPHVWAGNSLH